MRNACIHSLHMWIRLMHFPLISFLDEGKCTTNTLFRQKRNRIAILVENSLHISLFYTKESTTQSPHRPLTVLLMLDEPIAKILQFEMIPVLKMWLPSESVSVNGWWICFLKASRSTMDYQVYEAQTFRDDLLCDLRLICSAGFFCSWEVNDVLLPRRKNLWN